MDTDFGLGRLERLLRIPGVTWRHDIDYHPECAVKMAEFEASLDVHSTFYLMLRSPDYNAFSRQIGDVVGAILEYGHQIGLHVDLGLSRESAVSGEVLAASAEWDYHFLGGLYPVTRKVSFHSPPRAVYWRDVNGFEHAMSAAWQGIYITDSRGVWHQHPETFLNNTESPQACLHPEWWFLPQTQADELREREAAKP